jgi:hypothetical protein
LQKYEQAWLRAEDAKTREMVRDRIGDSAAQFVGQSLALPALQLYRACLRFNEQLGYAPAIAATKFNIGAVLFQQLGQNAEALPLLREAAETFAEHHHPFTDNARQLLARCEAKLK